MDRRTGTALVVATIGILAIALAAATVTSTVVPGSGVGGDHGAQGEPPVISSPPVDARPIDTIGFAPLSGLGWLMLLIGLLIVLGGLVIYRRQLVPVVVGIVALGGLGWLLWYLLGDGVDRREPPYHPGWNISGIGEPGVDAGSPTGVPLVVWAVVALLGIGAVVLVVHTSTRRSVGGSADDGPTTSGQPTATAIGQVAGETADRLERGSVDNEVYRAWKKMTALLDVPNPDATAAGEFAAAAIDAGMAPGDVRELTRLFEDVRYGGSRPTESRERRAVRVFRRIESGYAPGEP